MRHQPTIHGALTIEAGLWEFVAEMLVGIDIDPDRFWDGLQSIVTELGPRNTELLARRDSLQEAIDGYLIDSRDDFDVDEHVNFLHRIGYLGSCDDEVQVSTANVDREISEISGPQLVVPLDNARYALNAANARWGSFYDALYGTDVISESDGCGQGPQYNPIRGDRVVAAGRDFLDLHFKLDRLSHHWTVGYEVADGALKAHGGDGTVATLTCPERFVAYTGDPEKPGSILLRKNGLGCDIRFCPESGVGLRDHAGISDIRLESAVTVIMDCEDSVSAVDLQDKIVVYNNWLGLMTGSLACTFHKNSFEVVRRLEPDLSLTSACGSKHTERGRALMLIRNVGHHLETDIVRHNGRPIPETFLDCLITSAAACHDLQHTGTYQNSRTGSVYIVKPKMHGPDEVKLACDLFDRVEDILGIGRNTLKMGIMDEERRTSLNLRECLYHAQQRLVFINTGFLDRTGSEIHTVMEAGPVLPKDEMKDTRWLLSYEDSNVDTGLACGLSGHAQIGKGMWAKPAEMAEMCRTKLAHPNAGANCAWVPSPTAATLHAVHYFRIDVADRQRSLIHRQQRHGQRWEVNDMVTMPILPADRVLEPTEIEREIENNAQSILGYTVRWVGQGVGCSTVPDMDNVGLMEDLATLRISSQHMANWLHHEVVSAELIETVMRRMAVVVDRQNSDDDYEPMAPDFNNSIPFQAASALVFGAREQPDGYTETVLRHYRRLQKARHSKE